MYMMLSITVMHAIEKQPATGFGKVNNSLFGYITMTPNVQ